MGRSLDELIQIEYLSTWDIVPMSTKPGYKLVLSPGDELLRVLAISQRKELEDGETSALMELATPELDAAQRAAVAALVERGVSASKAELLARRHDAESIPDQIEYSESLMANGGRKKFENPAGFIIYMVENGVEVPASFVTSRRRREKEKTAQQQLEREVQLHGMRIQYEDWANAQIDAEIERRYSGPTLKNKIKEVVSHRMRHHAQFGRMTAEQKDAIAVQFLRRDLKDELALPSFEQWCHERTQFALF
jgi:hypothetical protein